MPNKLFEKIKSKITKKVIIEWVKFFGISFLIVGALYLVVNYVPYFANRQHYIIVSSSMHPTIKVGDVAIINTDYDVNNLEVGDIIAFYENLDLVGPKEIVVHYIADIQYDEEEQLVFSTKRESIYSQVSWDNWQIHESDIIGQFDFKISYVGKFLLFLESAFGKAIVIADIVVIYILFDIYNDIKKKKNSI